MNPLSRAAFAFDGRHIVQNAHEFGAGEIATLATSHRLHPRHGQVLKAQVVELVGQCMRQLEEPIAPLVDHGSIKQYTL